MRKFVHIYASKGVAERDCPPDAEVLELELTFEEEKPKLKKKPKQWPAPKASGKYSRK